jgi:microcystin-dependent protein
MEPTVPLETATHISGLVPSNPAASDPLSGTDDHLRLIKSTIKATFPNFTDAALNSTQAQIDAVAALLVGGVLRANGAVPAGAIQDFGMPTAPTGWLACDGQAVSRTTYADLFAAISTTWGAGDGSTTFNVPDLRDRFRRHKGASFSGPVGTVQNPQNLTHTHTGGGTTSAVSNDHTHTYSGTTGSMNRSNPHSHPYVGASAVTAAPTSGGAGFSGAFGIAMNTSAVDINHEHAFSGTTSGISANHTHTYGFTTSAGSADGNEARPYSATVLACIKT